jgi:dipeptidyl aminopeptidase/acylaminoacyl peptidase
MTAREMNWPWIYTTRESEEDYSPWWRQVWMKPISAPIDSLGREILTARCIGQPVVAPAGDRVVTNCGGHWLIFDTSGTELNSSFQTVQGGVSAGDMKWSADGKYLAFARMWEDDGIMVRIQACVSDVTTNQVKVIAEDSGSHHASYSWSPSLNLLAFSDGTTPIRILRISGGAP